MSDHSNTADTPKKEEKNFPKNVEAQKPSWGFKAVKWFFAGLAIVLIALFSFGSYQIVKTFGYQNIKTVFVNFITSPADKLATTDGRTNILLMGKAGRDHEGGELTDTMILVSVSSEKRPLSLLSIPRDLWIPEIRAKVNSAYYWGKQREPADGLGLAKSTTEDALGVSVHYAVVLDFSAFKDIVDVLGGINVDVERGFTDSLYPIAGKENDLCDGDKTYACRYETITFNSGIQKMDGTTALKFVRSRHADGEEGTDTAREARQQKVIDAITKKILTPTTLLNIHKDLALWEIAQSSMETDTPLDSAAILARRILTAEGKVERHLIPEDLLFNPPISPTYDKQYVFIPKLGNGKWREVQKWVSETLP